MDKQLNLRASTEDVERLDRLAEALSARTPGVSINRSSAARAALVRGLDELEREIGGAAKASTRTRGKRELLKADAQGHEDAARALRRAGITPR